MSGIQFQNKTQLKHAKSLYWHLRDDYISNANDFDKKAVKYFKGKLSGTYHGRKWRVSDGSRIITRKRGLKNEVAWELIKAHREYKADCLWLIEQYILHKYNAPSLR